jgi:hypothetical protein
VLRSLSAAPGLAKPLVPANGQARGQAPSSLKGLYIHREAQHPALLAGKIAYLAPDQKILAGQGWRQAVSEVVLGLQQGANDGQTNQQGLATLQKANQQQQATQQLRWQGLWPPPRQPEDGSERRQTHPG